MSIRHLKLVFAHVCVAQLPVEGVAFLCKTIFLKKLILTVRSPVSAMWLSMAITKRCLREWYIKGYWNISQL